MKANPDKYYLQALRDVIFDPMSMTISKKRSAIVRRATIPALTPARNAIADDNLDSPMQPSYQANDQNSEGAAQGQIYEWTNSCDNSEERKEEITLTGLQAENVHDTSIEGLNKIVGDDRLSTMNSNQVDEVCNMSSIIETVSAVRNQDAISVSGISDVEGDITEEDFEPRRLSLMCVGSILSPDNLTYFDAEYDSDDS